MLHVQKFIIENGIDALKNELGIAVSVYPEHGLMTLNYSQIDSPKNHPVVRECRALILQDTEPYGIISRSFDRFYNYGECQLSDQFDITKYVAWEKLDGSIMPVYFHNGNWHVSTRKMAFAEGINTQGFCFNDLFRQVVDFSIFDNVNTELTMIFEMVSPKNRIVKRYEQDDVYLLAVRNKKTGEEYNDVELKEFAYKLGLKVPKVYPFNSEDAVFSAFKDIDPFDEGFVCVNYETKHRIKIKNPSYVAIAHLRENGVISPKRIAILVMEQDHEEYLNIFPEDAQFFNPYIDAFERMKEDIHNAQAQFSSIAEQKEFALAIQHLPVKSILFQLRKGLQLAAVLDKLSVDSKLNLLEKYKR